MQTIFIDENIPLLADTLTSACNVISFSGRLLKNEELIREKCDALIVRSITKVNHVLLSGTGVKFVGSATAGIDHIDSLYLKNNNINFAYAAGSNANSVAEYVIYSVLKWSSSKNENFKNLKIGIVGFGNVGKIVAYYCFKLGLKVYINDPPLFDSGFIFPEYVRYLDLQEISSVCDIITNHVPLIKDGKYPTYKMFDKKILSLLKHESLFIHTSRGLVVDEAVLSEKISDNNITAIIDVWENEPDFNTELAIKSLIATPHIAGYSYDGKLNGALIMSREIGDNMQIEPNFDVILNELHSFDKGNVDFNNDNSLLNLLKDSRQIDEDYFLFKLLCDLTNDDKKKGFDGLRKNYPIRRECLSYC